MRRAAVVLSALALLPAATAAQPQSTSLPVPACNTRAVTFRLDENATRRTEQSMDGRGCHYAVPGDAYTTYQELRIVRRPANLTITPNSNGFGFTVQPRGGFRGSDAYVIRACGRDRYGPGCVTIDVRVTVY